MTHRQEAALETRRKIIDAGRALVRRGGFAGASVEAITRAAGVAKGTFYVHFPTKEHLAAELCREPYETLSREVLSSAGPLRRRLGRLFRGWAGIAEASGVEIAREWFRIAVRPAEAAELGLVFFDRDRAVVRTLLCDAVAAGELRRGTPIGSLADALSAQMQGLAAVWCMTAGDGGERLLPAVERFLRDHLPALLAPHVQPPNRKASPCPCSPPATEPNSTTKTPAKARRSSSATASTRRTSQSRRSSTSSAADTAASATTSAATPLRTARRAT